MVRVAQRQYFTHTSVFIYPNACFQAEPIALNILIFGFGLVYIASVIYKLLHYTICMYKPSHYYLIFTHPDVIAIRAISYRHQFHVFDNLLLQSSPFQLSFKSGMAKH